MAPSSFSSAVKDARRIAAGRDRKPGRDQRILDLECADQRKLDIVAPARMFEREALRVTLDRDISEPDALAVLSDREDVELARARRRDRFSRRRHGR